jgi:aspartate/methionine/tyrosine aminotransferase
LTTPAVLEEVGVVASKVGAKVLVDEVYLDSVPGLDQAPAAALSPGLISTASLTKAYGLSGLRAGWVLAEPKIVERVKRVRDIIDAVGPFPTEVLAYLAFRQLPVLRDRARGILEPNLALLAGLVESRPELEWVSPAGGSVGFPRIRGMDDTRKFVERLRSRHDTGVVPGHFFEAPEHFRVALGGRSKILKEGLARLDRALDEIDGF